MNNFNLKITFDFLLELKVNNNREWFNENKDKYQTAKDNFELFVSEIISKIHSVDKSIDVQSPKDCMFRIYKDVRFSKNKEPYKTNFGCALAKGGRKSKYAGYYIHFEPDNSFVGGGIYMPTSAQYKRIRADIFDDSSLLKNILKNKSFNKLFGGIYGDSLKTAPRGYSRDFEDISLLNHKHYAVIHPLKNEDFFNDDIVDIILKVFKVQFPFNNYLNSIFIQDELSNPDIKTMTEEEFIKNNFGL